MNISLSKFAKATGLPKSSVYSRCQELHFNVTNGLTPAMVQQLEYEFDVVMTPPSPTQAIAPDILPSNFLQTSDLAPVQEHELQLPPGFDVSAMVRFFDGVTGDATDTRSLVAIADLALNAVETAMDTKVNEQRQKLTQAEQDALTLAEKISDAKTNLKVKALESRLLAERQTNATQTAERLFNDLMTLGKPAAPGADGSSSPSPSPSSSAE